MTGNIRELSTQIEQWERAVENAVPKFYFCRGRKFRVMKADGEEELLAYKTMVSRTLDYLIQIIDIIQRRPVDGNEQVEGKSTAELDCLQVKRCCDRVSAVIVKLEAKDTEAEDQFAKMNASCVFKFQVRLHKAIGNIGSQAHETLRLCKEKMVVVTTIVGMEAKARCFTLKQQHRTLLNANRAHGLDKIAAIGGTFKALAGGATIDKNATDDAERKATAAYEESNAQLQALAKQIEALEAAF